MRLVYIRKICTLLCSSLEGIAGLLHLQCVFVFLGQDALCTLATGWQAGKHSLTCLCLGLLCCLSCPVCRTLLDDEYRQLRDDLNIMRMEVLTHGNAGVNIPVNLRRLIWNSQVSAGSSVASLASWMWFHCLRQL